MVYGVRVRVGESGVSREVNNPVDGAHRTAGQIERWPVAIW